MPSGWLSPYAERVVAAPRRWGLCGNDNDARRWLLFWIVLAWVRWWKRRRWAEAAAVGVTTAPPRVAMAPHARVAIARYEQNGSRVCYRAWESGSDG